jgi:hypothetical protein
MSLLLTPRDQHLRVNPEEFAKNPTNTFEDVDTSNPQTPAPSSETRGFSLRPTNFFEDIGTRLTPADQRLRTKSDVFAVIQRAHTMAPRFEDNRIEPPSHEEHKKVEKLNRSKQR